MPVIFIRIRKVKACQQVLVELKNISFMKINCTISQVRQTDQEKSYKNIMRSFDNVTLKYQRRLECFYWFFLFWHFPYVMCYVQYMFYEQFKLTAIWDTHW